MALEPCGTGIALEAELGRVGGLSPSRRAGAIESLALAVVTCIWGEYVRRWCEGYLRWDEMGGGGIDGEWLLRRMGIRAHASIIMSQLLQELRPPYGCLGDRRGGSAGLSVLGGGGRDGFGG